MLCCRAAARGIAASTVSACRPMSHLFFLARGNGRPNLRQVLSNPDLHEEFFVSHEVQVPGSASASKAHPTTWAQSRGFSQTKPSSAPAEPTSLGDIFQELDNAAAVRKKQRALCKQTDRALEMRRQKDQQIREASYGPGAGEECAVWAYCDPPGPINPTPFDRDVSITCTKNPHLQGIYNTPEWKPPHWEQNVHGGWDYSLKPEHPDGTFRTKAKHRMFPTELVFAERLEEATRKMEVMQYQDELVKTVGSLKKQVLEARAAPHSSLNRSRKAWVEQTQTTNVLFSTPEPYKPGENQFDEFLRTAIEQPARSSSNKRNFICNRDRDQTSHWRPPKAGHNSGTVKALQKSEELLLPPGVKKLREEEKRRRRSQKQRAKSATA